MNNEHVSLLVLEHIQTATREQTREQLRYSSKSMNLSDKRNFSRDIKNVK